MDEVKNFLESRLSAFQNGRYRELVDAYALPMPLFANGELEVMHSGAQLERRIKETIISRVCETWFETTMDILSIRTMPDGRACAKVIWSFIDMRGITVTWFELDYFLDRVKGALQISMIEVTVQQEDCRLSA